MSVRVLFLGENWHGSCARACCYALRRLGCDVADVDVQTIRPQWRSLALRGTLRLLRRSVIAEYNELVLETAEQFQPDLVLAFKGQFVKAETLERIQRRGAALYNYYPDTSAFAHGSLLPVSLPLYDCVFYTKRFWEADVRSRITLQNAVYLPHGYDPEIHVPLPLDAIDARQYQHDVVVIATYTLHKEKILDELLTLMPEIDLCIWGNQWSERCRTDLVPRHVQGRPLCGVSYAKAIRAARINLAIMSGIVEGASQGDQTTTRSYEIPACGGFMLHERTNEVLSLYKEGEEVACFSSVRELVEQIRFYLLDPAERDRVSKAGFKRCVPAYSYDSRMIEILDYHTKGKFGENRALSFSHPSFPSDSVPSPAVSCVE